MPDHDRELARWRDRKDARGPVLQSHHDARVVGAEGRGPWISPMRAEAIDELAFRRVPDARRSVRRHRHDARSRRVEGCGLYDGFVSAQDGNLLAAGGFKDARGLRSEEHTSELQ